MQNITPGRSMVDVFIIQSLMLSCVCLCVFYGKGKHKMRDEDAGLRLSEKVLSDP